MRVDKTHQCPIGDCERRHGPNDVMCSRHWATLSQAIRDEVWRLYRTQRGSHAHRRAVLNAIVTARRAHEANKQQEATSGTA